MAAQVAAHSQAAGLAVWERDVWTNEEVIPLIPGTDLVLAIGGDGAILQAARLAAPFGVPVLGLNMGYLGFLAECRPDQWPDCLAQILAGQAWIEQRLMVRAEVWRGGECVAQGEALNDVVVSRNSVAKTIHLEAYIDEGWVTNYHADGLIIATATGSTAYALAVGGPILPPELDNIMLIPVAPHLSLERAVILSQGAALKIIVSENTRTDPILSLDGQAPIDLRVGDEIRARASDKRGAFLRVQERNYFFRSLMDRMEPRFLSKQAPR
jgi:NAD+ kinase